ncbi:MAG TPA: divalent-cation tolerance protein CutA [bacterium]|nr:divalent-cation tolerance protein CutA [bacterium]
MGKNNFIQIITTFERKKDAKLLANILLKKRVAVCIQIIENIESYYWWEGKIEKGKEILLFIKTKEEMYKKIEKIIKENHPYKIPEIISFKIHKGSKEYLKWIKEEIGNND